MNIQPGDILASKYRVDGVLGTGGMGVVVSAMHLELEQRVAIKLPLPQTSAEATFATRFMREGRNAAKIRSDHVARVLDVGRTADGTPFLVMEYLEGEDLARHLRAVVRLSVPDAVDLVLQTCDAVAAAHAVGIVHRDLKPANLFLERGNDGSHCVKVLDFGISKLLVNDPAALEAALTSTTGVIGSPMYMSPEQMVAARSVDARTDVWSLGLILFKCLTGKTPWPSGNVIELAARIARDPPLSPRSLCADIPEKLEAVILHCLEKDRELRVPTALALATAIASFDPGRGELTLRRMKRVSASVTDTQRTSAAPAAVPALAMDGSVAPKEGETLATAAITLHTVSEDAPNLDTEFEPRAPVHPSEKRTERLVLGAGPELPSVQIQPDLQARAAPESSDARSYGGATTGFRTPMPFYTRTRVLVGMGVVACALVTVLVVLLRTPTPKSSTSASERTGRTEPTPTTSPEPTNSPTSEGTLESTESATATAKTTTAPAATNPALPLSSVAATSTAKKSGAPVAPTAGKTTPTIVSKPAATATTTSKPVKGWEGTPTAAPAKSGDPWGAW